MADVARLMDTMTLAEKVAQLSCGGRCNEMTIVSEDGIDPEALRSEFPNGLGQLGRPSLGRDADAAYALTTAVQRALTAAGHPRALFNEEGVHGLVGGGATVFPSALAMASTWDPDLIEQVYTAVAREARYCGSNYVYAPVLDLARDARWGRIEETFGEDPHVVARFGLAAVRGLQGRTFRIAADRVLACAKHFVGHGVPQAGNNGGPVHLGPRELIGQHAVPFELAIEDGQLGAVMAAYHDWDGVPTHANAEVLTGLLRERLGFSGVVTSDGFGVPQLCTLHHVAADDVDASRQAFTAGIDFEVPRPGGSARLGEEVEAGRLDPAVIDRACRNVLVAKDRLGLLEDNGGPRLEIDRDAHGALSRKVAERAMVLLTNERGTLPLEPAALDTILVTGPNASDARLGGYTDPGAKGVSILEGIRHRFGHARVVYSEGCRISEVPAGPHTWWQDEVALSDPAQDDDRIDAAVASAGEADVAVVAIGGSEATHREGWWFDHLGDRAELTMAGRQDELVERIAATGTTTIAVVVSAGPVDLRRVVAAAEAVIWTCYPGEAGGYAVADLISGVCEPTGRLPVTFPQVTGQVPLYSAQPPSAGRGYLHQSAEPMFPFGHGLTYTSFEVGKAWVTPSTISVAELAGGAKVEVSVEVVNTGLRTGTELVRVEIYDEIASVTRPRFGTQGFGLANLAPGESTVAKIELGWRAFRLLNRDLGWVVEPGDFAIRLATSSTTISTDRLSVEA